MHRNETEMYWRKEDLFVDKDAGLWGGDYYINRKYVIVSADTRHIHIHPQRLVRLESLHEKKKKGGGQRF